MIQDTDSIAVVHFGEPNQNIDLLRARKTPPKLIVFICCFEWEWYSTQGFRECAQYAQNHRAELVAITGGKAHIVPTDSNRVNDILPCVSAESYPVYWMVNTFRDFLRNNPQWTQRIDHLDPSTHSDLFVCMNNKPHDFRCAQLDMLAKYDLIHQGKVSWDTLRDFDGRTAEESEQAYTWQYWNPDQMLLENFPKHFQGKKYGWNGLLPDCYKQCSLHLVTEATTHTVFFTEKIVPPLMTGKLFLATAAPGFHRSLRDDLGFELYDEVFDYDFDNEPDHGLRAEAIAKNFLRISDYTTDNWCELYRLVDQKIAHNIENLHRICTTPQVFMPSMVKELCELGHPDINQSEIYHHYIHNC